MNATDTPVEWAGRTFGQLTPGEQRRVIAAAGQRLSRELRAAAPLISEVLEGSYHGLNIERVYVIADIIQQQVLESRPIGTWWNFSSIARRAALKDYAREEIGTTLDWLVEHQYVITNGRGGCWVNYGRKS